MTPRLKYNFLVNTIFAHLRLEIVVAEFQLCQVFWR